MGRTPFCVALQNKTTVEYHEGVTAHAHYAAMGHRFSHPWDMGFTENARQIFGPSLLAWLVPRASLPGDGLRYPHSLGPGRFPVCNVAESDSTPLVEQSVTLTDRKGDRKRGVYADSL
jgi:hypothetical protein